MAATVGKVVQCKAAVCWAPDEPLVIEEVSVEPPRLNEVRIRMVSTSFCHSDLHGMQGLRIAGLLEAEFPIIFGHEGAGVVESVGPDVAELRPGDHVLPLFASQCGECVMCKLPNCNACLYNKDTKARGRMADGTTRITCRGKPVQTFLGCSTFSEYFVIDEPAVAKVSAAADLRKVGVAGCCVPTGVGAARVLAGVAAGASCAVWGLGAVGLATALGCKLAGAATVIGIDLSPAKEELAKKFGCTEVINPTKLGQPIAQYLQERFGGGCDFTFECIGNVDAMRAAFDSVRPCGGVCVVQGVSADPDKCIAVNPLSVLQGKQLRGGFLGGYRFRLDVPALVEEIVEGKIDCDLFITDTIRLEDINQAIAQMKAGKGIRYVMLF